MKIFFFFKQMSLYIFLNMEKYKSFHLKVLFVKYEQIEENHIGGHAERNKVIKSKRVERKTLGTTNLSASPLCLGRSWNRSS